MTASPRPKSPIVVNPTGNVFMIDQNLFMKETIRKNQTERIEKFKSLRKVSFHWEDSCEQSSGIDRKKISDIFKKRVVFEAPMEGSESKDIFIQIYTSQKLSLVK